MKSTIEPIKVPFMPLPTHRATHAIASSAVVSLSKPFTPNSLLKIRNVLKATKFSGKPIEEHTPKNRNAAVLIPLCNVGGEPGILLEVRAKTLSTHSGEIRCV